MRPARLVPPSGGGGQLTVEVADNGTLLRKVPAPGTMGAGGSPPGESPSHGAATTQSGGTVKAPRRRIPRDLVKRPSPQEQARTDGRNRSRDRRVERGVECCLKQNGAYYRHLTEAARARKGSGRPYRLPS